MPINHQEWSDNTAIFCNFKNSSGSIQEKVAFRMTSSEQSLTIFTSTFALWETRSRHGSMLDADCRKLSLFSIGSGLLDYQWWKIFENNAPDSRRNSRGNSETSLQGDIAKGWDSHTWISKNWTSRHDLRRWKLSQISILNISCIALSDLQLSFSWQYGMNSCFDYWFSDS
jgi:hypothetical protein